MHVCSVCVCVCTGMHVCGVSVRVRVFKVGSDLLLTPSVNVSYYYLKGCVGTPSVLCAIARL